MRYNVTITIPCDEDATVELWGKFSKYGFNTHYYEGYATLSAHTKLLDEVEGAFEIATSYDGCSIRLSKGK